jgi:predicted dehydrogenase
MRVQQLLAEGYLGQPKGVLTRLLRGGSEPAPASVPDYVESPDSAAEGAGFPFGLGSHYIDGLRAWFGDVTAVDGTLLTLSPNRRRNGSIVKADADDGRERRPSVGAEWLPPGAGGADQRGRGGGDCAAGQR